MRALAPISIAPCALIASLALAGIALPRPTPSTASLGAGHGDAIASMRAEYIRWRWSQVTRPPPACPKRAYRSRDSCVDVCGQRVPRVLVTGRVLAAGQPVAGAVLTTELERVHTDEDGTFTLIEPSWQDITVDVTRVPRGTTRRFTIPLALRSSITVDLDLTPP